MFKNYKSYYFILLLNGYSSCLEQNPGALLWPTGSSMSSLCSLPSPVTLIYAPSYTSLLALPHQTKHSAS